MPNKNYLKGRAKEYRVAKRLRDEGWTVLRTAGSHGLADLVAIRLKGRYCVKSTPAGYSFQDAIGNQIRLIQCKAGKSAKRAIKAVLDGDIKRWEGLYSVSIEVL